MKNYILILLLSFQGILIAQQTPKQLIDRFFSSYQTQPEKAVRNLYATNPWANKAQKDIDHVVEVINSLPASMGNYHGNQLIDKKKLGNSFVKYIYLVKYDRQPIVFYFKLYQPDKKWMIYEFSLNDKIDIVLDKIGGK